VLRDTIASVPHPLDRVLVQGLAPGIVYAVGGRVRDELRAQADPTVAAPKDLDYVVTGLSLDDLTSKLREAGRLDVVGASFAVVKFRHEAGEADIALPRREHSTGIGHKDFAVSSGPDIPIEADLGRRDFRMNMIARRLSDGVLVDPYGGVADIAARRIDIVTPQTFAEDPLRMLRAAQFAARFNFTLSDAARSAMTEGAAQVTTVSPERIGEELAKLFAMAVAPSVGLEILRETGVLAHIWPEVLEGDGIDQNIWHAYDVYRHNLATLDATPPGDITLRIAALLHDVGKPRTKDGPHFYRHEHVGAALIPGMLARLRLPNETVETVAHLVRQHMYRADPALAPRAIRRFIQRIGPKHLERLFALRAADVIGSGLPKRGDTNEQFQAKVAEILAEAPPFTVKDLAITGGDIITLLQHHNQAPADFRGDARVGAILKALFESVTDEPSRNTHAQLQAEAGEIIQSLARSPDAARP
jgi:tRNA nucleotidyltransferase (CCA-adding enzyme)